MQRHAADGKLDGVEHVYIGDTERLPELVQAFVASALEQDIASARVYARLSCTDRHSQKYHIVSVYQTERLSSGLQKQLLEATWVVKGRTPYDDVVAELMGTFSEPVRDIPKYGGKLPEIVGPLHEYK
ncbi:MAG TPA: hypothetical protein PLV59_02515 [Candidatus Dojkabacteria bacterium]|nr:hypothetical protein [Candidatus Dojkabacteria bacterium]